MFVIVCYDVTEKRVTKVRKTVSKYLRPVQNSVFEGFLTESRVSSLKKELSGLINTQEDSVVLYKYLPGVSFTKDEIGVRRNSDIGFL